MGKFFLCFLLVLFGPFSISGINDAISKELTYYQSYIGAKNLSSSISNSCVIFGDTPTINISGKSITGDKVNGKVEGNKVAFEVENLKYEGIIVKKNGYDAIEGSFSENSGSTCRGNFKMVSDGTLSEARGKEGIIEWLKKFNPIRELLLRRILFTYVIDHDYSAEKYEISKQSWRIPFDIVGTNDVKVFTVPLEYAFNSQIRLETNVKAVWIDDELLPGDIAGSATWYSGGFGNQRVLSTLSFELPTGSEKVSARNNTILASQSRVIDVSSNQYFLNYAYQYAIKNEDLDVGDVFLLSVGLKSPSDKKLPFLGTGYNLFGTVAGKWFQESEYKDTALKDNRVLIDLNLGLMSTPNNFRLGFTIPVLTKSEDISNSDRSISIDAGYNFQ